MSDQGASPTVPPAWYQDPGDARQLRYWDGRNWTNQTAPRAEPQPQPQPVQAASSAVAEVAPFQSLFDEPRANSYTPFNYSNDETELGPEDVAWSPNTVMGWLYAGAPALLAVLALMPLPADLLNASDLPVRAGLVLLFCVVAVVLPAIDRIQLRNREYLRSPPAVLGLLPPIFSIVRAACVGRRGLVMLAISLLVQVAVAGLLYFHFSPPVVVVPQPAPSPSSEELSSVGLVPPFTDAQKQALLTPAGMAAKIKYDAAGSALNYETVTCDALASTEVGTPIMCTAVGKTADYDIYVQLFPTGDGVPFTVMSVVPSRKI